MNKLQRFGVSTALIILVPSLSDTQEFSEIELADLPESIRQDMFRYIRNNVEVIDNPGAPHLVSRSDGEEYYSVIFKYGSTKPDGPGILVRCWYVGTIREKCWNGYYSGRQPWVDPPLPEFKRPLVNEGEI